MVEKDTPVESSAEKDHAAHPLAFATATPIESPTPDIGIDSVRYFATIARLEGQLRKLRRNQTLLLVLVAIGFIVALTPLRNYLIFQSDQTIRARNFAVVDQRGQIVGNFGCDELQVWKSRDNSTAFSKLEPYECSVPAGLWYVQVQNINIDKYIGTDPMTRRSVAPNWIPDGAKIAPLGASLGFNSRTLGY